MNNNNLNTNDLMKMLSNMDKDQLEKGLAQASKILNSPDAEKLLNNFKKENK